MSNNGNNTDKAKIDKLKVWVTEKGKQPKDSNLAIEKNVSESDLNNPFEFDIWTDFLPDNKEKKKETEFSFRYKSDEPSGEILVSIQYHPTGTDVKPGVLVTLDGTQTRPSSSDAFINSWKWTVRNEGGMTYSVTNSNQPSQASFTCPDLNWMYISLAVSDSNGKRNSKEVYVDIGMPQEQPAKASLTASPSNDVKSGTTVTLDASGSIFDTLTLEQISGFSTVLLKQTSITTWEFVAPQINDQLIFQLTAEKGIYPFDTDVENVKVTKDVIEPPIENKPPVAVVSNSNITVKPKDTVDLYGLNSYDPEGLPLQYQWTQTLGKPVNIINANTAVARFTAPELDVVIPPPPQKCPDGQCKDPVTKLCRPIATNEIVDAVTNECKPKPIEPPPIEGDIDQFGQQWFHANGQQFLVKQSRDEASDDRWSANIQGLVLGYESQMIAKSIGIGSGGHFASKLFGGNHSGSGASSQRWYDLGVRANGDIQLEWEGPHPTNHDFTLPDRCWFIKKLPKGSIENRWVGLHWLVYKVNGQANGSPSNGGVRVQMWVNDDPISADGKKVLNENWKKAVDFIDGVDVNVISPQSFCAPDDIDIEIRRSDTDEHEVWGGGQHVRRLGTFKPPSRIRSAIIGSLMANNKVNKENERLATIEAGHTTKPCTVFDNDIPNVQEITKQSLIITTTATPKAATNSELLSFRLKVTDDKGLSSTANVNVTVTETVVEPPPPTCPPGQHWDPVQNKCVPNDVEPEPEEETIKIGHIGDTHGNHEGFKLLKTRENCNFILHSGDFTDTESDDDGYIQASKDAGLTYGVDFANAQGNHSSSEEGGEGAQEDMETAFPVLKPNKWLQLYQVKNVAIIIGNTQLTNYSQIDSETSKHIQSSLVKAKQLRDEGKIDWIIYMQHKPMWVIKNSGHSSEYNFRYVFHPLFDQYGVDFMVSGHTHIEQRTLPLIFPGEGTNIPPQVNSKMVNGDTHDFTVIPHGIICCPNGSSTKSHSLEEDTNAWTAYAADDGNAYTVFEFKGKKCTGRFIDIQSGAVRHEFKVSKGEGTVIEPPVCPPGYYYDPVTKQCVPEDIPPPPGTEFTFNISGDYRDTPESGHNLISDKPNLILTTGDYGISTNSPEEWCNEVMKMWLDSKIETWGIKGNHDSNDYMKQTQFFKNAPNWEWTVKKGTIGFVGCNTISENVQDADQRCAGLQNDPNIKKVIVLIHEGVFHPKVGTSVSSDTTLEFHNTFKKYSKVKMVICGHTHVYARSKPIDNILYIMNGIGGQSPTTGSTSPNPFHKVNGALHCTVSKDGSITCNCVPNAGDAPNIMDTFMIGPNGELPTTGVEFERRD